MKQQDHSGVYGRYEDVANFDRLVAHLAAGEMRPLNTSTTHATSAISVNAKSPSAADEVGFVNRLKADGTINGNSYWDSVGKTAYKWGSDNQCRHERRHRPILFRSGVKLVRDRKGDVAPGLLDVGERRQHLVRGDQSADVGRGDASPRKWRRLHSACDVPWIGR